MDRKALESDKISDADMDSLHILPLAIMPLETDALKRARMVKNVRLESMVELYYEEKTGSGQITVDGLPAMFGWPQTGDLHPDHLLLRKLAKLASYDVYSLRKALRQAGITEYNDGALKLSPAKAAELTRYMAEFTHPMIQMIYGQEGVEIKSMGDLFKMFRDPDVEQARRRLRMMSEKLSIRLEEVPSFLEDYGDIFLSLSYYRQCLDHIAPIAVEFFKSMDELKTNWQLKGDSQFQQAADYIRKTIQETIATVSARFENFEKATRDFWVNLSPERFNLVKVMIEGYHTEIGGVLCGLTVKMMAWRKTFPNADAGGPAKRGTFIMTEMRQGLESVRKLQLKQQEETIEKAKGTDAIAAAAAGKA